MRFDDEQRAWLDAAFPSMSNAELAAAFSERFGVPMSCGQAKSYGARRGLRKADGVRGAAVSAAKGAVWSAERDAWMRSFVPGHTEREIRDGFEREFGVRLTRSQVSNRKVRLGLRSGTNGGRFEKGARSWNAGKSWDEQGRSAESRARSLATCFKPGRVNGANARPLGFERVSRDGYVEVKVRDGLQEKANCNFAPKHRVVWERANGRPVPPRSAVVFADGDKRNFDPANLVAVPRDLWAVIARRRIPYWDAESLEVAMAAVRLVREAAKAERKCRGVGGEGRGKDGEDG